MFLFINLIIFFLSSCISQTLEHLVTLCFFSAIACFTILIFQHWSILFVSAIKYNICLWNKNPAKYWEKFTHVHYHYSVQNYYKLQPLFSNMFRKSCNYSKNIPFKFPPTFWFFLILPLVRRANHSKVSKPAGFPFVSQKKMSLINYMLSFFYPIPWARL